MPRVATASIGRSSAKLAASLRERILRGVIREGDFLPTERELAVEHEVARKTVGRALDMLQSEGLICSSPRHGHRVLACAYNPSRGAPLAYVRVTKDEPGHWRDLHGHMLTILEEMAGARGWSLLAITSRGGDAAEVFGRLEAARACGVLLDTRDGELLARIREAGVPAVMVDSWIEGAGLDAVLQDSYLGGLQAAEWLISRGHKRIAWLGDVAESFQSRERFGGAMAAVVAAGLDLPKESRLSCRSEGDEARALRQLLAGPGRPTAVLALWRGRAEAAARAARELGLVIGRDLDIVGWSTEEGYATRYLPSFDSGAAPAAITWSAREAAETAMFRLTERQTRANMPAVQIRIPTRLKAAGSEEVRR